MLDHIGHRLLNQPVNGRLEFWRGSGGDSSGLEGEVDIERHVHPTAFTDAIHQDLERGLSAELVECGRPQLRDQTLQAYDDLLDSLVRGHQRTPHRVRILDLKRALLHHVQRSELLERLIVKFAWPPLSLPLRGGDRQSEALVLQRPSRRQYRRRACSEGLERRQVRGPNPG